MARRYDGKHEHKHMYDSRLWIALRSATLNAQPLCQPCKRRGVIMAANTVHHTTPHRGDWGIFLDSTRLESCCARCHSSDIQQAEVRGYGARIGHDGYPLDPRHPFNKTGGG